MIDLSIAGLGLLVVLLVTVAFLTARGRRWSGALAGAALLLVLAALGPRVPARADCGSLLLLDVSASTGVRWPSAARAGEAAGLLAKDCRVVLFGESPVILGRPDGGWPEVSESHLERAGRAATNLAGALQTACALAGPGTEVVIATDGRVDGKAAAAGLADLRDRGARIRVVPYGRVAGEDLRVDSMRAPPRVRAGSPIAVDMVVVGAAGTSYGMDLSVNGESELSVQRRMPASGRDAFRLPVRPLQGGFHEIEAGLRGLSDDPVPQNDRQGVGVVAEGARRARLFNAGGLEGVLAELGFECTSASPGDAFDPMEWDLIALRDIPSPALPDGGAGIREYVRAGGGLLVLGGPRSFGPGGYAGRPLEECLPLRSGSGDEELVIVLLLDCSGTMGDPFRVGGSGSKLGAAKSAALRLVEAASRDTVLYVVLFAEGLLASPEPVRLSLENALDVVGEILEVAGDGRGGTALGPPLRAARDVVRSHPKARVLTLLLTDGRLEHEDPGEVLGAAAGLLREARGGRLAALAVGEDADLEFLGRLMGPEGEAVRVGGRGEIEKAFLEALLSLEGGESILLGPREVRRGPVEGGPFSGDLPPVSGLVRTWPKERAEVWYTAEGKDALVAGWRFGLGKVAAVTTDPLGPWASGWMDTGIVSAVAEFAARGADMTGVRAGAVVRGGSLVLTAHCPARGAVAVGRLLCPGRPPLEIRLDATGPGRFTGEIQAPPPGPCRLVLIVGGSRFEGGASIPYPEEFGETGPEAEGLTELRALVGADQAAVSAREDAGYLVALMALLLILLDRVFAARRLLLKCRPPGVR